MVVIEHTVAVSVLKHLGVFDVAINQLTLEARRVGSCEVDIVEVKAAHRTAGTATDKQHLDDLAQVDPIELSQVDVQTVPAGNAGQQHTVFLRAGGAVLRYQLESEGAGRL